MEVNIALNVTHNRAEIHVVTETVHYCSMHSIARKMHSEVATDYCVTVIAYCI